MISTVSSSIISTFGLIHTAQIQVVASGAYTRIVEDGHFHALTRADGCASFDPISLCVDGLGKR